MPRKRRKDEVTMVIPLNPTANITDSMRAEGQQESPEVFENSSVPATKVDVGPPNVAISLQSTPRSSTPTQEAPKMMIEREPQIKYNGENDILLEFQGDVLSVYTQSSGTVSYDSFAPLQQDYLDKMRGDAKQISCKGPDIYTANEVNMIDAGSLSRQPSLESFNQLKFNQSVFAKECPGSNFEQAPSQAVNERCNFKPAFNLFNSKFLRIVAWAFYENLIRLI